MSVEQFDIPSLNDEGQRNKLMEVLETCSDSLIRIQAEKDLIKEQVSAICEELQIPKKLVNKMVKVYYKQNFDEEVVTHEQFETLYEKVVKGQAND